MVIALLALSGTAYAQSQQTDYALVQRVYDIFAEAEREPGTTLYRDVHVTHVEDIPVVCGKVNLKNAMGGYTGFLRFYAKDGKVQVADFNGRMPLSKVDFWRKH